MNVWTDAKVLTTWSNIRESNHWRALVQNKREQRWRKGGEQKQDLGHLTHFQRNLRVAAERVRAKAVLQRL